MCGPGIAFSDGRQQAPIGFVLQWNLSLDSTGRIVSLLPVSEDYQRAVRQELEPLIQRWHFTAGKLDGQPAPTETTLNVNVALDPSDDAKSYRVRIVSAGTGATYKHVMPPEYPKSAMHMGRDGGVWLRVDYDAEGRVTAVIPIEGKDKPWVDGSLMRAAVAAVKHWTMRPEMVAGHGVAGAVIAPICFSLSDHTERCSWTPPGVNKPVDPALPITLTSVVGLDMGAAGHSP
jgi:TonB family protein